MPGNGHAFLSSKRKRQVDPSQGLSWFGVLCCRGPRTPLASNASNSALWMTWEPLGLRSFSLSVSLCAVPPMGCVGQLLHSMQKPGLWKLLVFVWQFYTPNFLFCYFTELYYFYQWFSSVFQVYDHIIQKNTFTFSPVFMLLIVSSCLILLINTCGCRTEQRKIQDA